MNRKYIIISVLSIFFLAAIILSLNLNSNSTLKPEDEVLHRGVTGDPMDIVLDFYELWKERKLVDTVDENTPDPVASEALSFKVIAKLQNYDFSVNNQNVDPVFCQVEIPEKFRVKYIFQEENREQILVTSSDKTTLGQAAVTVEKHNELWEISDISCSRGEQAPEVGEFSFDREGRLLRDSLPEIYNKDTWYLVYTEDDVPGYLVPLMLDGESICTDPSGNESVCSTDSFRETLELKVQGQMLESGVMVKKIFIKE